MRITGLMFPGTGCHENEQLELQNLQKVNVVIGPNNAGKTHLIRSLESHVGGLLKSEVRAKLLFDYAEIEAECKHYFVAFDASEVTDVIERLSREEYLYSQNKVPGADSKFEVSSGTTTYPLSLEEMEDYIQFVVMQKRALQSIAFERHYLVWLAADRDVNAERIEDTESLDTNGRGATQLVEAQLRLSNDSGRFKDTILDALNKVLGEANPFIDIDTMLKERRGASEIKLRQKVGKFHPISSYGSGVKTTLLVALKCHYGNSTKPMNTSPGNKTPIYAFEELENNMHPAVLKRLLDYILEFLKTKEESFAIVSTHSSVVVDWAFRNPDASITRIAFEEGKRVLKPVTTAQELSDFIFEIGCRPSELLQANGVIWVEGPSDRIYINRMIELWSDGKLRDGVHYVIACYGGSNIATTSLEEPEELSDDVFKAISLSRNVFVISDSDKQSVNAPLKPHVVRISEEVEKIGTRSQHWITECKEIENYFTGNLIARGLGGALFGTMYRDPLKFEAMFIKGAVFWREAFGMKAPSKVDLARKLAPVMTLDDLKGRYDLDEKMSELIRLIEVWNK